MAKLHIDIQGQAGVTEELTKEDISTLASCVDKVDDDSDVRGSVHADVAYGQDVQKVRERFPNLELNVDVACIHFEDPEVERVLLASTNPKIDANGDGIITIEEAEKFTGPLPTFDSNPLVTSFDCSVFPNMKTLWSVTYNQINDSLFRGCKNLSTVNLGNVETVHQYAFNGCSNLKHIKNIENLKHIGINAFDSCPIETPDGILRLPNVSTIYYSSTADSLCHTFSGNKLKSIVFGDLIEHTGSGNVNTNPFCSDTLEALVFGTGIKYFGNYSLGRISNFKCLVIGSDEVPTYGSNIFYRSSTPYIYVPDTSVDTYKTADGWSACADKIKPISSLTPEQKAEYGIE